MRTNLWDDPRVAALVDATGASEATIVGGLYWLWSTADQHTEDGVLHGMILRQIDRKTEIPGFGSALAGIGWIEELPGSVQVTRFNEHNGASAKRRATESRRKMSARDADKVRTGCGQSADTLRTKPGHVAHLEREREREREEDQKQSTDVDSSAAVAADMVGDGEKVPSCPHAEIIELYHQILPSLACVRTWEGTRVKHMQTRWRSDPARQTLDWWRGFFEFVAESDFLMGRKTDFAANLPWLIRPENFAKVLDGAYHQRVRA